MRGHWPRGKRRNPDGAKVLDIIRRVYRHHKSLRYIARLVGVDHRTINRWLHGEDYPSPARAAVIGARLFFSNDDYDHF